MGHKLFVLSGVVFIGAAILGCPQGPENRGGDSGQGRLTDTQGGASSGSGPHIERNGLVVVEAEHYTRKQADVSGTREWYLQAGAAAGPGPDPDGYHEGASGGGYMEVLPDMRVTHGDPMETGSYHDGAGGASLSYDIRFETPGTYYVWVRAYSTGTEDNGLHVGVDGVIPDSGRRIQRCGTGDWAWTSAQRDSGGTPCGENGTITIHIPSPGLHTVTFYQREDGFELDRFVLTTEAGDVPAGAGPPESRRENS
ncbi:MAG TPA: hypothetical protein PL151_17050 [Phycisphaerae bacterium]|nr:hypothetical protein [Phycisphaerae bacterium]HON67297.1 hypothetical protein [Phycisphaerae bacterium]HQE29469.1 hypothetical protein [Phycisphaerae bacterium]